MRIFLDPCYYDVIHEAVNISSDVHLCYYLYDNFTHWTVEPILLYTKEIVDKSLKELPGLFYYVSVIHPRTPASEIKTLLAQHYHWQIYGDVYRDTPFYKNLFDLKLID